MTLQEVKEILNAQVIFTPQDLQMNIKMACGCDLMSDVLAFTHAGTLLLTGLTNPQVVRTADMAGVVAIVFVRGKYPPPETISLAEEKGIPLLASRYTMYETCGRLYKAGLVGCGLFDDDVLLEMICDKIHLCPEMLALIRDLKAAHGLKVAAVSNEGRELAQHRVRDFGLTSFVDFFVVSSFVHFRKPDEDIYRLALDVAQAPANEVLYVDDRAMFVEVAQGLGIRGIHHTSYDTTRAALAELELHL